MQAFIGATLLTSKETQPQSKPFEIYDSRLPGFTLRVQRSGMRSYYARFGRNRRVVLGRVGTLAPEEARERCQEVLGNFAHGRHPLHGIGGTDAMTLGMFIANTYTTWVKASRPRTAATGSRPRTWCTSRESWFTFKPSCASEITSFTPRSPRRVSERRNPVRNGSASEGPIAIPSTSRTPSVFTATVLRWTPPGWQYGIDVPS